MTNQIANSTTNVEIEKMKEEMKKMQQKMDWMHNELAYKDQIISEQQKDHRKTKLQFAEQKFKVATTIEPCSRVHKMQHFKGIVVTLPQKYSPTNPMNTRIESYNWLYSHKLGLVRSMNEKGDSPLKFGSWYYFKTNDERDKCSKRREVLSLSTLKAVRVIKAKKWKTLRKTQVADGKLVMRVSFEIIGNMVCGKKEAILEDKFLNRIHLPQVMMKDLNEIAGKIEPYDELKIETCVELKKDFIRIFEKDANAAIFKIVQVKSVRTAEEGEIFE